MILRPRYDSAVEMQLAASPISAWEAVATTQQQQSDELWLITQHDHARLSGEVARHMHVPGLAPPPDEALRGIALHDSGWQPLDEEALAGVAPPASFLHATPDVALRAWRGSIEQAGREAALAGYLVSRHFWRLGRALGEAAARDEHDRTMLRRFLSEEEARQHDLLGRARISADRAERLVDLLQFCDLLSLYLCCGARADATFPEGWSGQPVRLRWRADDGACLLEPSPFPDAVPLELKAVRFPRGGEGERPLRWLLR